MRCFLRQVSDQQRHYAVLSQHLGGLPLSSLVRFQYVTQGIRVGGPWFPKRTPQDYGEELDNAELTGAALFASSG